MVKNRATITWVEYMFLPGINQRFEFWWERVFSRELFVGGGGGLCLRASVLL